MSSKVPRGVACLHGGVTLLIVLTATPAPCNVSEVVKAGSSIVFVGTVKAIGQPSFNGVPPSARILTVELDEDAEVKPSAASLEEGDLVTVEVTDPAPFSVGASARFYTEAWVFGEGIALRVLGHQMPPADVSPEVIRDEVEQAHSAAIEARTNARIDQAEVVFRGKVKTIAPLPSPPGARRHEHDPDWYVAVVEVLVPYKGVQAGDLIEVRFPRSIDVKWYQVPKLKAGDERTFVLSRDPGGNFLITDQFAALPAEKKIPPSIRSIRSP